MPLSYLFCIIFHFASHVLHWVIMIVICICARSRGAENGSSNEVKSPMGDRRSTSVKLRGC
jgi:hypothetical protein